MKKLLGLLAVAPMAITACGGGGSSSGSSSTNSGITLITDAGDIDDKSFNEQAWNAVDEADGNYIKPSDTNKDTLLGEYDNAIAEGAGLLVLPGFLHGDALAEHADENEKTDYIFIDGWGLGMDNVTALNYLVEQASYIAGYYATKELYDADNAQTEVTIGMYGGMDIPSVTGFMHGFAAGAKAFADTETGFDVVSLMDTKDGEDVFYFSGSFDSGDGTTVTNTLLDDGADIIFPVAGPQTFDSIDAIKNHSSNKDAKVIGVDTDFTEHVDADDKDMIMTSVLKDIYTSTTDAIEAWQSDDKADWDADYSNKAITGGLEEEWVGVADFGTTKVEDMEDYATVLTAAKAYKLPA